MKACVSFAVIAASLSITAAESQVGKVQKVAPAIYFHEGNITQGHCNQGWIIFKTYTLVVDGNFPGGVQVVLPKIKATTDKPIKFVVDTHHHGDHAYGNMLWFENGAIPVASSGALVEMKKYETALFGGKPGRWEWTAKTREDVRASQLLAPMLTFDKRLVFDDGDMRAECLFLGNAHTHGDVFVWLPKQSILFTGDACVNGPYNYMGDGQSIEWLTTLDAAKALKPKTICPGHGPIADGRLLDDQKAYFTALHNAVKPLIKKKLTIEQVRAQADAIREQLLKDPQIKRYVGMRITEQIEKVFGDYTGQTLGQLDISK